MRFGLSPARRQPRFSVGTDTSNAVLRCVAASCARNASSSPITQCIASSALWPRSGSDECPDDPCSAIDSIMKPLWAKIGRKSVGSPTTANCGFGMSEAARQRAPAIDDSSSEVATIVSGALSVAPSKLPCRLDRDRERSLSCRTRRGRRSGRRARSAQNGLCDQCASSYGTVSVCPASTSPPVPSPIVAIRLALPGAFGSGCTVVLKPSDSSHVAELVDDGDIALIERRARAADRRRLDQRLQHRQ